MDDDLLIKLKSIDPEILSEIICQDQRVPSFQITELSVRRLSDKGIANPDGLWLFSGQGNSGDNRRPWSVVLKILERDEEESPPDTLWYWKREFLLAQSGLTKNLTGPVKAPRYYRLDEMLEGAWIWMEYLQDTQPRFWTLDNYAFAARQLGLWNGAYLTGTPLPDEPWLTHQHYKTWLSLVKGEDAWQFPLNQKHITKETYKRYMDLWDERERFFNVLESLPHVFSHFDSQRRNLFIRLGEDQQEELVAVDWAQCGIGALGSELNWMVGVGSVLLEWPPAEITALDAVVFQNYLQGLRDTGWTGDADVVRLGYVTMLALFIGCAFPSLAKIWCSPENRDFARQMLGKTEEDLFLEFLPLLPYALDCSDEARSLMKKVGIS